MRPMPRLTPGLLLDLTDVERFALRNLLAKTIETSRRPLSRRILTLKTILAKLVPIMAPSSRSHPDHEPWPIR
jgi:hypothetical protein